MAGRMGWAHLEDLKAGALEHLPDHRRVGNVVDATGGQVGGELLGCGARREG